MTAVTDMICLSCKSILLRLGIRSLGVTKNQKNGLAQETIECNCSNCGSKYQIIVEQLQGPTKEFKVREVHPK
jgi:hypothetical protein